MSCKAFSVRRSQRYHSMGTPSCVGVIEDHWNDDRSLTSIDDQQMRNHEQVPCSTFWPAKTPQSGKLGSVLSFLPRDAEVSDCRQKLWASWAAVPEGCNKGAMR